MSDHRDQMHARRDDIDETGLHHLSLHTRPETRFKDVAPDEPTTPRLGHAHRKRFPENLHFAPSAFRLRSPTESSMSSLSSANFLDSATTRSVSTLASPISTSYASEVQELFAAHSLDSSRPPSRIFHRHKGSTGTCSTFVNDEEDGPVITGYPELSSKLRDFRKVPLAIESEQPTRHVT